MSEVERAAYAEQADELARLRKTGRSLKKIGVERLKSRQVAADKPTNSIDKTDGAHIDKA